MPEPRKNPLTLIEAQVIYQVDEGPLKRVVVNRLHQQKYIKRVSKYDRETGRERPSYYMTAKGYANKDRAVLPGWEAWMESVERKEINGLDATKILYSKKQNNENTKSI